MLGNFTYCNPTKLYFGEQSLEGLHKELPKYGDRVVLIYGGGSIKRNGIYDAVRAILDQEGKQVAEIAGVMPNPTLAKLYEGIGVARAHQADLLLAVGGGSVCDYAKAVAVSVHCPDDPWEKYYLRFEEPDCPILPVGCVLTMVGTGSEMNAGSVITNQETRQKIGHVFADEAVMPRFSILNPRFTLTLPREQMVAGIYDIFNHICEQYFSGEDDNTSDYLSEGLMRSLLCSSRAANRDPQDYEARSNIMWTATWALNTLVSRGKSTDWMVHMLGQAVGGLHQRHPRHDAGGGLPALLPAHPPLWAGQIQAVRRPGVGSGPGGQDRPPDGGGGAGGHGGLDEGAWADHEYQCAGRDGGHAGGAG